MSGGQAQTGPAHHRRHRLITGLAGLVDPDAVGVAAYRAATEVLFTEVSRITEPSAALAGC
ncbi:hypothetical protein ACFV7R_34225 [Streptomyces sp. NPDC059866]|uniref:hypothetical protein n=1 Tax=Streptomyces sp. NPDC059866 TaxID=3346978 RepID=UPI00365B9CAC